MDHRHLNESTGEFLMREILFPLAFLSEHVCLIDNLYMFVGKNVVAVGLSLLHSLPFPLYGSDPSVCARAPLVSDE